MCVSQVKRAAAAHIRHAGLRRLRQKTQVRMTRVSRIGDGVDDALPALFGRQPGDDAQRAGQLAHFGALLAVDDVVDIRAALLIPEHLEAGFGFGIQLFGPLLAGLFAQPGGHFGKLAQPARPDGGVDRRLPIHRDRRPVDQRPLDDVFEHAVRVLERHEPAQHARDAGHERRHHFAVAAKAVQVVDAVDPMQRPVGDGHAAAGLGRADHRHGQDAVVAGRVGQGQVLPGQAPVGVGDQADHLVHHAVAHPGLLLAGGAVGEGIARVEVDGADAGLEDLIQLLIRAVELRARLPGVDIFLHGKIAAG